jgi:hypothetical protein
MTWTATGTFCLTLSLALTAAIPSAGRKIVTYTVIVGIHPGGSLCVSLTGRFAGLACSLC